MSSRVMFRMEWPPLSINAKMPRAETSRMPASLLRHRCAGTGPLDLDSIYGVYRNCTPPDYALGARDAWVYRPGPR